MESLKFGESDFLACCGSNKFARKMASLSPFRYLDEAAEAARDIWFDEVDVTGWLEAFAAHPEIGKSPSHHRSYDTFAQLSRGEQSAAMATTTTNTTQELYIWNAKYREKFGFVFLIFASGRSTPEILEELKRRYSNRPIVELENAAKEHMKITELRLASLFAAKANAAVSDLCTSTKVEKAGEDRLNVIGTHLAPTPSKNPPQAASPARPPITTHVLDVSRGCPASGVEVCLDYWKGGWQSNPSFQEALYVDGASSWTPIGLSKTDKDGRSGQLMEPGNLLLPGLYRISFNTGKYNPGGFYPFASVVFQVGESQTSEHFHVPLLLSNFSFSTYRGS